MKVQRAEFKKKRWYKRRQNRRNPISRILKVVYAEFCANIFPITTPYLSMFRRRRRPEKEGLRWGGASLYFDVETVPRDKGATESGG